MLRDRAVFPVYQPIWDLTTAVVVGIEALARGPAGTAVESAPALFAAASAAGLLSEIDQLCFTRAVEVARELGPDAPPLLFVNAEPEVLNAPISPELVAAVRAPRSFRLVAEYTERALAAQPEGLVRIARIAHNEGNAIAMDDVGADPTSLAFLPLLEPEVIKFDLGLLRDPHSRSSVEAVTIVGAHAERTGAVIVAEGIETEEDVSTARGLGAWWGQGWLLGRPGPLTALAGLPTRHSGNLLPEAKQAIDASTATPFDIAAEGNHPRPGDRRTIEEISDYLMASAAIRDPHAVVLAAYSDDEIADACLPRVEAMADTAAFIGVATQGQAQLNPQTVGTPITNRIATSQTALAVIGPFSAAALCARSSAGSNYDVIVTHDPARVSAIARLLLGGASDETP